MNNGKKTLWRTPSPGKDSLSQVSLLSCLDMEQPVDLQVPTHGRQRMIVRPGLDQVLKNVGDSNRDGSGIPPLKNGSQTKFILETTPPMRPHRPK